MPLVQTHVRDVDLFLSLENCFFPWSNSNKPSLTGLDTLIPLIATSCITNTVSQFFSGTQAQRAETPPPSSQRLADGFMRFKKQMIMSLTSPISSLRTLATRTSPSCSTRTPSSLPTYVFFAFNEDSTSKGTWCMVLFIIRGLLRRPSLAGTPTVTFCSVHIQNMSWPRNVTLPLIYFTAATWVHEAAQR